MDPFGLILQLALFHSKETAWGRLGHDSGQGDSLSVLQVRPKRQFSQSALALHGVNLNHKSWRSRAKHPNGGENAGLVCSASKRSRRFGC